MKSLLDFIKENVNEGILDIEKNINDDSIAVDAFIKKNCSGSFKYKVLKHTQEINVSSGEFVINNYDGTELPSFLKIASCRDGVVIANCPNLTNLDGLFGNDEFNGSISISHCKKMNSISALPKTIDGSLTVTGNDSLKSLSDISSPVHVTGNVYMVNNGKKFKQTELEKYFTTTRKIYCSAEDEFNDELIELIAEAFKDPRLSILVDKMNSIAKETGNRNINFKYLFGQRTFDWSRIDASRIKEFHNPSKSDISYASKAVKNGDMVVLLDESGEPEAYIWDSEIKSLVKHKNFWVWGYKELMNCIKNAPGFWVLDIKSDDAFSTRNLQLSRRESRRGMVTNTPEYYAEVVKKNMVRYKEIIAKNKALNKDSIAKDVEVIMNKCAKIMMGYSKCKNPWEFSSEIDDLSNYTSAIMNSFRTYVVCKSKFEKDGDKYDEQCMIDYVENINKYMDKANQVIDLLSKAL